MTKTASELLGQDGPFASSIDNFSPRPQQQQMADAIEQALDSNQPLIVEAGTGTGKTYAYLVAALMSGKKAVISTGTRNLQDQLFHRDLPKVLKALGIGVKIALLKGRSNYICHHRLDLASEGLFPPPADELFTVNEFSRISDSGDIEEISSIQPDAKIWPLVTSNADNCLGQDCGRLADCFLLENRRRAQEADILVVNHHLFFADLALREEGFGEVLPFAEMVIFDEAHLLPGIATQFFGFSVSSYQLHELSRDCLTELRHLGSDMPDIKEQAELLETSTHGLHQAMGMTTGRHHWKPLLAQPAIASALETLVDNLKNLNQPLKEAAKRSREMDSCYKRSLRQQERLSAFLDPAAAFVSADEHIQWTELRNRGFRLSSSPLETGDLFRAQIEAHPRDWIFTSATLSANNSFSHFQQRMGLEKAKCLQLDTPFDYQTNALLYLPKGLPAPNSPDYLDRLLEKAVPVLNASRGRAFMLFTSFSSLHRASELLPNLVEFPILVQGSKANGLLLDEFRDTENGVLLGTNSFWQGVDVQGDALSCVIIDKLPFASPEEPLVQARIEHMRKKGQNPFNEYQVPESIISLKQGVGRLIRDNDDRGVMMICDPRLTSKGYGKAFLNSLPPMRRVEEIEEVEAFF